MNRHTKIIIIVLVLAVVATTFLVLKNNDAMTSAPVATTLPESTPADVSITEQQITDTNYSGSKPVISGTGALADAARAYVEESLNAFAATANKEVPERVKEFGNDSPAGKYTIDINAALVEGVTTRSIVIDSYIYMGGANGNSTYKAFTAIKDGNTILPLTTLIPQAKQSAFVAEVKKELIAATDLSVFKEDVAKLTIPSLSNYSIDKNGIITIYFDKYQVGAGALGAVAFPLSADVLQHYIATTATPAATGTRVRGPETITLAINQSGEAAGLSLKVTNVSSDSRCPSDVQCIQAGTVTVSTLIGTAKHDFVSSKPSFTFGGYTIEMVSVSPTPLSTKKTLPSEYEATFKVSPTAQGDNL